MLFDFFFKPKAPQKLPFATDIHCHVVPGVDDGSPDAETSVELLSHMADWGFERIFASPHSTADHFENTPQTIAEPFTRLKEAAAGAGLQLGLEHHFEYRVDQFFIEQLKNDNIKPLPDDFILIENGFDQEPWGLENIIFELLSKGYRPVMAHPERYRYYRHNISRYAELHDKGLLFQINLLSLAGHYKGGERDVALRLLKQGMVSFIGTDVHHMGHVESIERYMQSSAFGKDIKLFDNLLNDSI